MRWLVAVTLVAACSIDTDLNRLYVPPHIVITAPQPLEVLRKGEGPVLFAGIVSDEHDEPTELAVTWVVDQGEPIVSEAGANEAGEVELFFDVAALDLGTHVVELMAMDTDGELGKAGVQWELVGPLSAPIVEITAPGDGELFAPGVEIAFRGMATDDGTDPEDLSYRWRSDRQGDLPGALSGGGQSAVFTSDLEDGAHKITLEVTDPDGDVGADSIEVRIGEVTEEPEPGDIVFSELMINPQVVADEVGEWVELYNTASYALDVGGYSFHDNDFDFYILEGPLIVAGKDYLVLCANVSRSVNGGVPCDAAFRRESADALALGNNADEVILSRPDGVVIDELHYDRDWFEPAIAIGLSPEWLESGNNDIRSRWCNQTTVISTGGEPGTPGQANDPC